MRKITVFDIDKMIAFLHSDSLKNIENKRFLNERWAHYLNYWNKSYYAKYLDKDSPIGFDFSEETIRKREYEKKEKKKQSAHDLKMIIFILIIAFMFPLFMIGLNEFFKDITFHRVQRILENQQSQP